MTLVEAMRVWMKEDKELAHYSVEHSDHEDFDADWIICSCSDHILASIKESSVTVMTKPLGEERLRLPSWFDVPMSHPQFFEMIKFALLRYHREYL